LKVILYDQMTVGRAAVPAALETAKQKKKLAARRVRTEQN